MNHLVLHITHFTLVAKAVRVLANGCSEPLPIFFPSY